MFKTILVATEGSEAGNRAVETAARLAHTLRAALTVAMVIEPAMAAALHAWRRGEHDAGEAGPPHPLLTGVPGWLDRAREHVGHSREFDDELAEIVLNHARTRALAEGMAEVRTIAGHGDAVESIIEIAASERPDLLVFGSRGLGVMRGLLLGSVSLQLSQLAPCPCLIVR
ncbi:MAG: universal stress protein [Magnetospirillum sp. WYHS-4]